MSDTKEIMKYAVTLERLERAVFVVPSKKSQEVKDALFDAGWRIVSGGPYTDHKMFPRVDPTRSRFIAERVLPEGGQ